MKPKIIKKQISQNLTKIKINSERFQISVSSFQTIKKNSNSESTFLAEKKNLILEKLIKSNQKTLQKSTVSKSIIKQNSKNEKKIFAIGSTDLLIYDNKTNLTSFLEQKSNNSSSLNVVKLNNFIFQMPQNHISNWFLSFGKIKGAIGNISLIPIKALTKMEYSRSLFEKKEINENN